MYEPHLRQMGKPKGKQICHFFFFFLHHFDRSQLLKVRICSNASYFFPLQKTSVLKESFVSCEAKRKSQKLFPCTKIGRRVKAYPLTFICIWTESNDNRSRGYKRYLCSTQLSMKF